MKNNLITVQQQYYINKPRENWKLSKRHVALQWLALHRQLRDTINNTNLEDDKPQFKRNITITISNVIHGTSAAWSTT